MKKPHAEVLRVPANRIHLDLFGEPPTAPREYAAVTLGVFDGLHRGHHALVDTLLAVAEPGERTALITFSEHPRKTLQGTAPPRLLHPHLKDRLLGEWGLDDVLEIQTSADLFDLKAEEFLERLFRIVMPRIFVVGPDFHFGKNRGGSKETIEAAGVPTEVVTPVRFDGRRLSATAIRGMLASGRIEEANRDLGYEYSVLGVEEAGDRIGRRIEVPTLNLVPVPEVLQDGIYAVRTRVGDAVAHLGPRPVIDSIDRRFEVHILDGLASAEPKQWEVSFVARLRDVENFASLEEMKSQIDKDIVAARKVLASSKN